MKLVPEEMMLKSTLLFWWSTSLFGADCAKILGVFYLSSNSHYKDGVALMNILAQRGHEVTFVSSVGEKTPPQLYREVVLEGVREQTKEMLKDFFHLDVNPYHFTYLFNTLFTPVINSTLSDKKLRRLMDSEKFDLVIIEQYYSDGLSYIAHHLKVPLIYYCTADARNWIYHTIGNSAPLSYVPDILLPYTNEMTFLQRADNTVIYLLNELVRNFIALPEQSKVVQSIFPGAPDISEYSQSASLAFVNGDLSISNPVPKVPGLIDIGGFHIAPTKALPEDLDDVLNKSMQGAILFSMGSNLQSANLPNHTLATLMRVFSKLKETILWKWETDNLPGKPDNVLIRKWLPQNDILAHPNIKLFITHGGIHSIQETVYHGVPCLLIPVFSDQKSNSIRAVNSGYGKTIKLEDISEETLLPMIQELLKNPKYSKAAEKASTITRDKIISPVDTFVFWTEYVLRHNGADHLRVPALKMYWYQYLLLDVILCFIIFLTMLTIITIYLIKLVLRKCKENKVKHKKP